MPIAANAVRIGANYKIADPMHPTWREVVLSPGQTLCYLQPSQPKLTQCTSGSVRRGSAEGMSQRQASMAVGFCRRALPDNRSRPHRAYQAA